MDRRSAWSRRCCSSRRSRSSRRCATASARTTSRRDGADRGSHDAALGRSVRPARPEEPDPAHAGGAGRGARALRRSLRDLSRQRRQGSERDGKADVSEDAGHDARRDAAALRWRAVLDHRERRAAHRDAGIRRGHRRIGGGELDARSLHPPPAEDHARGDRRDGKAQPEVTRRMAADAAGSSISRRRRRVVNAGFPLTQLNRTTTERTPP